ncbi:MAG: nucleotidyl transferase AbiEii/AbiGii toxin family protein [Bacteroidetes bacterium]|nr:nucleotidyl transferase AbiEii/AbiGii toxin family protein [Bacteroidota bacterium]
MKSSAEFYTEKLYPLQDGVLKIVRDLGLPFYLTGGTALSRHYLHHRFSDDIDLFVNSDDKYSMYVDQLITHVSDKRTPSELEMLQTNIVVTAHYARFFVAGYGTELKVDLVNDVRYHFGEFEIDNTLGKLDAWRNILSNKVAALFRFEAKDYVDVWALSRKFDFNWDDILNEARYKEASVDPGEVSNLFRSFPFEYLISINWIEGLDYSNIKEEFAAISEDIFYGRPNGLK